MATLDTNLLNEFAKTVTADEQKDDGVLVYGIVTHITDDGAIVRLDGKIDNTLTPCATGVSVTVGDRVTVNIGRNQATIIANSTANPDPNADSKLVGAGKIIADYVNASFVKTDYLEANYVTTNHLETNYLETGQLDADYASIAELMTDYIKTTQLNAEVANLGYLKADSATITDIQADTAKIHNLTANEISAATIYVDDLNTNHISVSDISAATGYVGALTAGNISANNLIADHGTIGNLDTNYAKIDAANITTATIRDAWVNQIMVQSGLLASEGTVFYLDAIKVNAESITAGTIDVERIVVTDETTGDKHMVTWDDTTQTWVATKLDGDVIQDLTITADKIVAGAITADKITTQNIVGTGGWINLRNGTFNYSNATSGNGISWDGSALTIQGNVKMSSGVSVDQAIADVEEKVTNASTFLQYANQIKLLSAYTKNTWKLICGTSAGYDFVSAGVSFNIAYPILCLYQSSDIAANNTTTSAYLRYPSVALGTFYGSTIPGFAINKKVYLKGTIVADIFTVASSDWITATEPASDDSYYYIPLGSFANNATSSNGLIYFISSDKLYKFYDGSFQPVSSSASVSSGALTEALTSLENNLSSQISSEANSVRETLANYYTSEKTDELISNTVTQINAVQTDVGQALETLRTSINQTAQDVKIITETSNKETLSSILTTFKFEGTTFYIITDPDGIHSEQSSDFYQYVDGSGNVILQINKSGINALQANVTGQIGIGSGNVGSYTDQWAIRKGAEDGNGRYDLDIVWIGG